MGADAACAGSAGGHGGVEPACGWPAQRQDRARPAPPQGSRYATLQAWGTALPKEQFYQLIDVMRAIASELGRSVSQVALNWVLQRPTVATLVIGARTEAQLRDNLGSVEFQLSKEHMQRLDQASAQEPVYPYWRQRRHSADRNPPPTSA